LGQPGGNLTGFSTFEPSIGGKWLALLKPKVSRISLLFNPETAPFADGYLHSAQAAAQMLGATEISAPCGNDADIQGAFAARARGGTAGSSASLTPSSPITAISSSHLRRSTGCPPSMVIRSLPCPAG